MSRCRKNDYSGKLFPNSSNPEKGTSVNCQGSSMFLSYYELFIEERTVNIFTVHVKLLLGKRAEFSVDMVDRFHSRK
jgi:hypothetical protein